MREKPSNVQTKPTFWKRRVNLQKVSTNEEYPTELRNYWLNELPKGQTWQLRTLVGIIHQIMTLRNKHLQTLNQQIIIYKVTFLSPNWRSLNPLKGHLSIPKRSLWITWYTFISIQLWCYLPKTSSFSFTGSFFYIAATHPFKTSTKTHQKNLVFQDPKIHIATNTPSNACSPRVFFILFWARRTNPTQPPQHSSVLHVPTWTREGSSKAPEL